MQPSRILTPEVSHRESLAAGMFLHDLERRILENYPWLVTVMIAVITIPQARSPVPYAAVYLGTPRRWDWLWITGVSMFLVLYPVSLRLPIRVAQVIGHLGRQGIIGPSAELRAFELSLHARARRWAKTVGMLVGVVMAVVWLTFFASVRGHWIYVFSVNVPGMLLEVFAAVAVGRFLGRLLCYGTLGRQLRTAELEIRLVTDHADGLARLASLGRIYLTPALLIAAMAAFVGIWVILIPAFPDYAPWQPIYIALLALLLICEAIAFLWPIRLLNITFGEWQQAWHTQVVPTSVVGRRTLYGLTALNIVLATPLVVALVRTLT